MHIAGVLIACLGRFMSGVNWCQPLPRGADLWRFLPTVETATDRLALDTSTATAAGSASGVFRVILVECMCVPGGTQFVEHAKDSLFFSGTTCNSCLFASGSMTLRTQFAPSSTQIASADAALQTTTTHTTYPPGGHRNSIPYRSSLVVVPYCWSDESCRGC